MDDTRFLSYKNSTLIRFNLIVVLINLIVNMTDKRRGYFLEEIVDKL